MHCLTMPLIVAYAAVCLMYVVTVQLEGQYESHDITLQDQYVVSQLGFKTHLAREGSVKLYLSNDDRGGAK